MRLGTIVPILGISALLGSSDPRGGLLPDEVRCHDSKRMLCSVNGCDTLDFGSAYLLSPTLGALLRAARTHQQVSLRRCDDKGCTPVAVLANIDGAFLDLNSAESNYLAKIYYPRDSLLDIAQGDFSEAGTGWLHVEVSFGRCPISAGD